ncbi:hypothetical protein WA026_002272 [Henosepilachna vigintioctopunctata]|uniref:Uncharacterized protein n=1 Tax=Henosepilachna vigintioctopunctata TaxID=420089 RepID=A0AAW1TZR5_9CUCU
MVKVAITQKWQNQWQMSGAKLRLIKYDVKPWPDKTKNRKHQVLINRLRLGHTNLTHSYLLNHTEEPMFDLCGTKLSVQHLFTDCPKYVVQRNNFDFPPGFHSIIGRNFNIPNILNFLKCIDIITKL